MIEKIRSLCNKYYDQGGLDIFVEFNHECLILRAYWYNESRQLLTYNRCHNYCNDMNIEELLDRFVDETLSYKRSGPI